MKMFMKKYWSAILIGVIAIIACVGFTVYNISSHANNQEEKVTIKQKKPKKKSFKKVVSKPKKDTKTTLSNIKQVDTTSTQSSDKNTDQQEQNTTQSTSYENDNNVQAAVKRDERSHTSYNSTPNESQENAQDIIDKQITNYYYSKRDETIQKKLDQVNTWKNNNEVSWTTEQISSFIEEFKIELNSSDSGTFIGTTYNDAVSQIDKYFDTMYNTRLQK